MNKQTDSKRTNLHKVMGGQALIEYALILALLVIALIVILQATGPTIGSFFENQVIELLGATPIAGDNVVEEDDFWLTVTWVHENPIVPFIEDEEGTGGECVSDCPEGTAESTAESTAGATAEVTPEPIVPTATPGDVYKIPPLYDTVDNPEDWRVEASLFLGNDDWLGTYFEGMSLDYNGTSPTTQAYNGDLYGAAARGVLSFPSSNFDFWTSVANGPIENWPAASPYQNWSARFTRNIDISDGDDGTTADITVTFEVEANDGVRLWLLKDGESASNCSATGQVSGGPFNDAFDDKSYGDPSTDCLLIDDWGDLDGKQTAKRRVTRTITEGTYTLQVDYYDYNDARDAILRLNVTVTSNEDDTALSGGVPVDGPVECAWIQYNASYNANSISEDWNNDDIAQNMRCHLEFRGFVDLSISDASLGLSGGPLTAPEFRFWDIWDMRSANVRGWLEVAEYVQVSGSDPMAVDRSALNWIKVSSTEKSNSLNWNWTRNVVDLTNINGTYIASGSPATNVDFTGKNLTFRFVMENMGSFDVRRWFVDDIEVTNGTANVWQVDKYWDLNDTGQKADFITSGHWDLTSNNAAGTSGFSWDLTIDNQYHRNSDAPNDLIDGDAGNDLSGNLLRLHTIELNGFIDASDPTAMDSDGDTGNPVLSFTHGYKIGEYTGLEVQYYDTTNQAWLPIPGPDSSNVYGLIETYDWSDTTFRDESTLTPIDISLEYLVAIQSMFRLRFVMYVHTNSIGNFGGWWIDNIKVHRADPEQYMDYPFFDGAEDGAALNWMVSGTWENTNTVVYADSASFADSPSGDYPVNTDMTMRLLYPMDLNNDSPGNVGNTGGAAVAPYLTFYHQRSLWTGDALYVEYRRKGEGDSDWKPLWAYVYGMGTDADVTDASYSVSKAWEFAEVDLSVIDYTSGDANTADDDVYIRFRLHSDGANTRDGVYIDNINIGEYTENSFKLWPTTDDRTVNSVNYGTGGLADAASYYTANVDEADWSARWTALGTWSSITWESRQGLQSWHESADSQTAAPVYQNNGWQDATMTTVDTFNVLELSHIIDLSATYDSEDPTLYFWTRYHIGNDENISIQIAEEFDASTDVDAAMSTRCNTMPQCYEQIRGWSEWTPVTFDISTDWVANYAWHRIQVPLDAYTSDGTNPGSRIRVRFVYDALNAYTSDVRDGWYIDHVQIGPRMDDTLQTITSGNFYDRASNMDNWTGEGDWGLSPERYRGSGNAAAFGTWTEYFWDCSVCENLGKQGQASATDYLNGADDFLDNSDGFGFDETSANPEVVEYQNNKFVTGETRSVTEINYDIYAGSPVANIPSDYFVGRWIVYTGLIGSGTLTAGDYTFTTISDNGVRMKIEEVDASNNVISSNGWNIIDNWTDHGRTSDMGVATLSNNSYYKITLDWYEKTDNAALILSTGTTNFSFTDTPKQGAGAGFDDIPAIMRSQSSLILAGSMDLEGTNDPAVEYYAQWELYGSVYFEVSTDGGFTWTQNGLDATGYDSPTFGNSTDMGTWTKFTHSLADYKVANLMLRFRLNVDTNWNAQNRLDRLPTNDSYVGVWLVDIKVFDQ